MNKSDDRDADDMHGGSGNDTNEKVPSLLRTTANCFGSSFVIAGGYKLIWDILSFVSPQILR